MFLERYRDLLKHDGRLATVIDESVLNTLSDADHRELLFRHFYIRAIFSLPQDAFAEAGANVKTSVLVLDKKAEPSNDQPVTFFGRSENIGYKGVRINEGLSDLPGLLGAFHAFRATGKAPESPRTHWIERSRFFAVRLADPRGRLDFEWNDPRHSEMDGRLEQLATDKGYVVQQIGGENGLCDFIAGKGSSEHVSEGIPITASPQRLGGPADGAAGGRECDHGPLDQAGEAVADALGGAAVEAEHVLVEPRVRPCRPEARVGGRVPRADGAVVGAREPAPGEAEACPRARPGGRGGWRAAGGRRRPIDRRETIAPIAKRRRGPGVGHRPQPEPAQAAAFGLAAAGLDRSGDDRPAGGPAARACRAWRGRPGSRRPRPAGRAAGAPAPPSRGGSRAARPGRCRGRRSPSAARAPWRRCRACRRRRDGWPGTSAPGRFPRSGHAGRRTGLVCSKTVPAGSGPPAAGRAFVDRPLPVPPGVAMAAAGATEAVRPARLERMVPAPLVRAEPRLEARHVGR